MYLFLFLVVFILIYCWVKCNWGPSRMFERTDSHLCFHPLISLFWGSVDYSWIGWLLFVTFFLHMNIWWPLANFPPPFCVEIFLETGLLPSNRRWLRPVFGNPPLYARFCIICLIICSLFYLFLSGFLKVLWMVKM